MDVRVFLAIERGVKCGSAPLHWDARKFWKFRFFFLLSPKNQLFILKLLFFYLPGVQGPSRSCTESPCRPTSSRSLPSRLSERSRCWSVEVCQGVFPNARAPEPLMMWISSKAGSHSQPPIDSHCLRRLSSLSPKTDTRQAGRSLTFLSKLDVRIIVVRAGGCTVGGST